MSDENTLRQKARSAIHAGRLPARQPARTWAGKGDGAECAVCERRLTSDDVEFELEFVEPGSVVTRSLHARCHAAWEFERRNAAEPPPPE